MLIYGKHTVLTALANKNRYNQILYCTENTQHILKNNLDAKKIKITVTNNKHLDNLTQSQQHQGLALQTSRIFQENLAKLYEIMNQDRAHLLILDHLEDPQNVGNIIRSAGAFDANAIILPKQRSVQETPSLIKACSGASEIIPIFVVPNIATIIKESKEHGFWVLGLDGTATENINHFEMPQKSVSIIGSEKNGIQNIHKKLCDWLIKIPISHNVESLNAATAAGIILNKFKNSHQN